jgi:tyrosinase
MPLTTTPLDRRTVLGNLAAAGLIVAAPANAQARPVRRSVGAMTASDRTIITFKSGIQKLKALPASDARHWAKLAAIHGSQAGFNKCPHGNWYFLPWHRAYLVTYEKLIRKLTGDQTFAMPYWDWTEHRGLPQVFASPAGASNPLWVAGRVLGAGGRLPDQVVGAGVMRDILQETAFELFGSSRPDGQNTPDPRWLREWGNQGELEANPHNQVHSRVGGLMVTGGSPLDPLFLMHHCNIDRLWSRWNTLGGKNTPDPLWGETPLTGHFLKEDGRVWSPKVKELLDPAALGYAYAAGAGLASPLPDTPQTLARLAAVLAVVQSGSGGGLAAPLTPEQAAARGVLAQATPALSVSPGGQATATLQVDVGALRRAAAAGAGLSDAQPTRVLAFARDIAAPATPNVEVRVFLNLPTATTATPTTDPHFVGSFGFFGGPHGSGQAGSGHEGHRPSVALDITKSAAATLTAGSGGSLTLTFVAAPLPGSPAQGFTIGRLFLAVV